MLYLRTLGGLALESDGQPVVGAQRARLVVLAVLAASGQRAVPRERIQDLLWPDSDTERARGTLKQALFHLRSATGVRELTLGATELRLNPDVIQVDRWEFEAALDANDPARAASVYAGDFLDGVAVRSAPDFERWRDREQSLLSTRMHDALRQLAAQAQRQGEWPTAVEWWRRLAAMDSLDPVTASALIRALAAAGDGAGAHRYARVHAEMVRQEFGSAVDPRVAAAIADVDELSRQRPSQPVDHAPAAIPPTTTAPTVTAPSPGDTPSPAPPVLVAPPPVSRRRRALLASAAVLAAAGLLAVTGAALRLGDTPVGDDRVRITADPAVPVRSDGPCARAEFVERVTDGLLHLRLARVVSERPRYTVTVGCREATDRIVFTASVRDERDGSALGAFQAHGSAALEDAPALDSVRSQVSALIAARLDPNLRRWAAAAELPERWDALQPLVAGLREMRTGSDSAAIAALTHAAALDTTSGTALVIAALISGAPTRALLERARTRPRLGQFETIMLARFEATMRGDLATAHETSHQLMRVVPGSEWAWLLAGDANRVGRATEALDVLRAMEAQTPADPTAVALIRSSALHLLRAHTEELRLVQATRRLHPDSRVLMQLEVKALAALGRTTEVEARCAEALAVRGPSNWSDSQPCQQAVMELAAHDRKDAARHLLGQYVAALSAAPAQERASRWTWPGALQAEVGDFAEAVRTLRASPWFDSTNSEYLEIAALAAAARRDRAAEARLLAELSATHPWTKGSGDEALVHAQLAALRGDRDEAVEWMRRAFRDGMAFRIVLEWPAFRSLRGYPPWERLAAPHDDPEHVTRMAGAVPDVRREPAARTVFSLLTGDRPSPR